MDKIDKYNELVSIIVPVYNSEKVLSDCIESVLNQTYPKWELILINDGSTDKSELLIHSYIDVDSRIKLYTQPYNMGVAAARNRGIKESKGRFIAFLDSDDMWKSNKLELQLEFMNSNGYSFTFTGYEMFNPSNPKKLSIINVPKYIDYKGYMKNTIIGNLTVIMDQKKLGKITVEYGELEDVLTWMKYLKQGNKAYGLDLNLAIYRVSKESISGNKIANIVRYFNLLINRQGLSFIKACYYHTCYMVNAIIKRR